jgi:acetoin utilization protein AcuB
MNVHTWMTPNPETIGPRDLLSVAQDKMQRGHFRRLPVMDHDGRLIGIITERDLRAHIGYLPTTHVDAAMSETPITIGPNQPIETAATVMLQRKIGGLPVVADDGTLLGIITESDLLQGLLRSVSGGEDASSRIDFQFTTAAQTFADAVRVVEAAGATILGLGTLRTAAATGARTFCLRVLTSDPAPLADALQRSGYAVQAVHSSPAGNPRMAKA